jgi:molecular chaperone GrpE
MPKPHKAKMKPDDEPQATDAAAAPAADAGAATRDEVQTASPQAPSAAAAEAQERAQLFNLEQRLAQAERQAEEINEKYLRALADLENYRRRARLEQAKSVRAGESAILVEVLPVLDNFNRAMEAAQGANDVGALVDGVRMIHDQLLEALARKGVRPIEAEGAPFDPTYHDAVGKIETTDWPEGTVVVEIQKGYMLGDQVLRPSRVMVAVPPADEGGGQDSTREES